MLKIQRLDFFLIFALSIFCSAFLIYGLNDIGLGWDEGIFIKQGALYTEWLKHPRISSIKAFWQVGSEHPPFHMVLTAITKIVFTDYISMCNAISGYRISTILFAMIQIISLYVLGYKLFGRFEAFISPLMLLLLPHIFFHAHLVSLDFSAMAMWTLLSLTVWLTWETRKKYYLLGIISGLALLTKINALFALFSYFVLLGKYYFIDNRKSNHFWVTELRIFIQKIAIPCFLTIFILWPWLWKHPFERFFEFINFHLHHFLIPTYYLGKSYSSPPWHYPYVMLFVTTPIIIFIVILTGFLFLIPKWREDRVIFLLTNAFLPLFLVQNSSAKYDEVRLFLPAFPFLILIGTFGLKSCVQLIFKRWYAKITLATLTLLLLAYLVVVNKNYYPYQGSYFSESIGGIQGAEKIGFDIHNWCNGYQSILSWLEKNNDKKYWVPICYHLFNDYKDFGKIHWTLNMTEDPEEADYWIIVNRRGLTRSETLEKVKQLRLVLKVETHQVGLVEIYSKREFPEQLKYSFNNSRNWI